MKAILLMFDSLNRHYLPPYGNGWVHAPNFSRLARRSVRFERAWCGSMPCMPARREIHTGRPDLLHRFWGPLEPFDESMPEMLKNAGVYTHLCSDHYHYWEEAASNYHDRYSTWEFYRGQEGDPWIGQVAEPPIPPHRNGKGRRQDWVNRQYMRREDQQPGPRTIAAGVEFLRRNRRSDNWFLQVECFDPHEPFFHHPKWRDLYPRDYSGPKMDWPGYRPVAHDEGAEFIEDVRRNYAASLSMCDAHLGDLLDAMDELDLWKDTMLIVNTDHGFMLGEHGCWAKNWQPWYEQLSHIPLFIWDPRCGKAGESRRSLVQTVDLGPTVLDFFGLAPTPLMLGRPLRQTIAADRPVREAGLFGIFGGHVNVTDGRYVYMRGGRDGNGPLYEYTLMPHRLRRFPQHAAGMVLHEGFSFAKGMPVLRIESPRKPLADFRDYLWDVEADPAQEHPIDDAGLERRMVEMLVAEMRRCEAPAEQYRRLGLG